MRHPPPFFLLLLLLVALPGHADDQPVSALTADRAAAYGLVPVASGEADDCNEGSGYTEIDEEDEDDEDEIPVNVMEEDYQAGRMAFLFGQYEIAYKAWLPLAEEGYAKAQASIAWMYHTGNGVERDYGKAAEWYRKAADQGEVIAQNNLGVFYENGYLGEPDPKRAAIWYEMSAKEGYSYAQYNLGMLYAQGLGVPRDVEKAKYWLRIAARNKVEAATEALGKLNVKLPVKEPEKPRTRLAHAPYHSRPVAQGIAWLKGQNPDHYTIQLARSRDLQWILKLAATENVEQTLIQFESLDDQGETWHNLIYGSFPSRKAARQAIAALPEPMRKWEPWIRRFADVQKQLGAGGDDRPPTR